MQLQLLRKQKMSGWTCFVVLYEKEPGEINITCTYFLLLWKGQFVFMVTCEEEGFNMKGGSCRTLLQQLQPQNCKGFSMPRTSDSATISNIVQLWNDIPHCLDSWMLATLLQFYQLTQHVLQHSLHSPHLHPSGYLKSETIQIIMLMTAMEWKAEERKSNEMRRRKNSLFIDHANHLT